MGRMGRNLAILSLALGVGILITLMCPLRLIVVLAGVALILLGIAFLKC